MSSALFDGFVGEVVAGCEFVRLDHEDHLVDDVQQRDRDPTDEHQRAPRGPVRACESEWRRG